VTDDRVEHAQPAIELGVIAPGPLITSRT
jgi:hypothetical protein